jgi:hypothetical protein
MATKAPKKAARAKRFVADPTKGLHPDTNKPRVDEIRVLTPYDSPSRIGMTGPGIRAVRPPAKKKEAADTNTVIEDSPVDRPMGAEGPRARKVRAAAKKPAKKAGKKAASK